MEFDRISGIDHLLKLLQIFMRDKIKDFMIKRKWFFGFFREYNSLLNFVIKLVLWVVIVCFITIVFTSIFVKELKISFSDIILLVTAGFIVVYTYETQKTREQIKENDIRPVVLRSGYIKSWESLLSNAEKQISAHSESIEFKIARGIATNIHGYIVIGGFKYDLYFGNDISKVDINLYNFSQNWGWMGSDTSIYGIFMVGEKRKTNEENKIYLIYSNIEGDVYVTVEDKDFRQITFKI